MLGRKKLDIGKQVRKSGNGRLQVDGADLLRESASGMGTGLELQRYLDIPAHTRATHIMQPDASVGPTGVPHHACEPFLKLASVLVGIDRNGLPELKRSSCCQLSSLFPASSALARPCVPIGVHAVR